MRAKAQEGLYSQVGPRKGREMYPAVYMRKGQVTHLLPPWSSPNDSVAALCGRMTGIGELWLGTGTEDEYDQARAMPLCTNCVELTGGAQ